MTNLNHYNSTVKVAIVAKLCRMVTCFDGFLPIKSHDRFITWSCDITSQTKANYISTTTVPMAAKLGRVMTYLEGLQTMESNIALITWFCKIT